MYRISELAKMAEVILDTIRYYEKQQMMEHEVRTEGGFCLHTEGDLQQLKFTRHARQLGFSLESIRGSLSIRIDPECRTYRESKGTVQERLQGVEARIAELQSMQRSLQHPNDTCRGIVRSSVYCLILEALEQGVSGVKNSC